MMNLELDFSFLFLLVGVHFFVDFAIQNTFVANYKNRHFHKALSGEEQNVTLWPWVLTAHAFHHGLGVYFVTQNLTVSVLEILVHWAIDFSKCEKWFNFHIDQILHILTKFIWFALLYYSIV